MSTSTEVKGVEVHPKAGFHGGYNGLRRPGAQQLSGKSMQLVSERVIRTGDPHKLGELAFNRGMLLAQYLYLPLNERDG